MQREDNARTVEGEVSSWPGIVPGEGRFGSTVYRLGRREIGHLHRNGVADLPIPKDLRNGLISDGLAERHQAGSDGYVSYRIRSADDVPGAIELFRMNYERAKASAERRGNGRLEKR